MKKTPNLFTMHHGVLQLLFLLFVIFYSNFVFAHGTVTSPASRVWICYQEGPETPQSPACIAAVASHGTQPLYDWAAIRQGEANGNHQAVVPDGNLASGGMPDIYGGMDQVRSDWVTTPVSAGPDVVTWTNNAPHTTLYYRVYITKDGWSPSQAITWDDLELVTETGPSGLEGQVDIPVVWPSRTGHHIVYSVWQRDTSPEAFYSTSDVDFGGGNGGTPPTVVLMDVCGDLKVEQTAVVLGDLEVDSDVNVGEDINFVSGDMAKYRMSYDVGLDKLTIAKVGSGAAIEIIDGEIYLPQYANGTPQNIGIDENGKLVNNPTSSSPTTSSTFGRYTFSVFEDFPSYQTTKLSVNLANGTEILGVEAYLLDNDVSSGSTAENSNFVRLYRQHKFSNVGGPQLVYELTGLNTGADAFGVFSDMSVINVGSNIVDNANFVYYVEISFCDQCYFREVTVLK